MDIFLEKVSPRLFGVGGIFIMARIVEQKNPSSGSVIPCYLFVTNNPILGGFVCSEILKKWAVSDLLGRCRIEQFMAG